MKFPAEFQICSNRMCVCTLTCKEEATPRYHLQSRSISYSKWHLAFRKVISKVKRLLWFIWLLNILPKHLQLFICFFCCFFFKYGRTCYHMALEFFIFSKSLTALPCHLKLCCSISRLYVNILYWSNFSLFWH